MNIFEQAVRLKLRFESNKGQVMVEDLFDIPLTSRNGFDLDNIAKTVNAKLRKEEEESFVARQSSSKKQHELALEIVKTVIAEKLAEAEARRDAAAKSEEKAKILEILARKKDKKLEDMSEEELRAQLASL